jgi:hypothetical protein
VGNPECEPQSHKKKGGGRERTKERRKKEGKSRIKKGTEGGLAEYLKW